MSARPAPVTATSEPAAPPGGPALSLDSVSKTFGDTVAVDNVTVSVAPGEFVAVVGPSGCGKSTLLRMASGLSEPSSGRRNLGEADERTRRPYTSTVEAIQIIRALLRGEPVPASEQFTVSTQARLDFEPLRRDLPVYAGAVNERMLRAAGAYADSVELGALMSAGYVRWALGVIGQGAAEAGRDPAAQDIAAPLMVSVAADARAAREAVKTRLAYYLHRVEKVTCAHSGADPGDIQKVRDMTTEQGPDAGAAVVTDEIIDTFAIAGDTALAVRRFREYAEAGIRGLIIQHVPGPERVQGLTLIAKEVVPHVL